MLSNKSHIMPMPDSVRKAMWARLNSEWNIPNDKITPFDKNPSSEDIDGLANDWADKYLGRLDNDELENVANHYELEVGDRWGKEGAGKFGADFEGKDRTREDLEDELRDIAIDDIGSTLNEIYDKKR